MLAILSQDFWVRVWWFPITIAVFHTIGVFVYLIFLHPLCKYPGPFFAKFTNLYAGYHAWKGDLHIDMWRCHQKYGRHVRYGPNRLLFDTAQALHDIYDHRSSVIKATTYNALVHRAPNTLTLRDKKLHGRKRRVLSQGFSDSALRSLEPAVKAQIQKFCSKIGEIQGPDVWSAAKNMALWSDYLAFDIMSTVIFSSSFDLLGSDAHRHVPKAIETSNVRMSVLFQYPDMSSWKFAQRMVFPEAIQARTRFLQFLTSLLKDRATPIERNKNDMFALLAKARDPETGESFGEAELAAESATLVVAGSDTSSTSLAAIFFYLGRNKQAYERVTAEVRKAFPSADVSMGVALNSCAFLRACIDETLRISPPAGSALWREVQAPGLQIDGAFVPAGCEVGVSIYALHHNPSSFPNPTRFVPERWLRHGESGDDARTPKSTHKAFAPFSVGPRGCIGKSLAMVELMMTLATVLWLFDFEEVEHSGSGTITKDRGDDLQHEYYLRDHITGAKNGPFLRFRRSATLETGSHRAESWE